MTENTDAEIATKLAGQITENARRVRADRRNGGVPPLAGQEPDRTDLVEGDIRKLTPNALRIAEQVDGIWRQRDEALADVAKAHDERRRAEARIEQMQSTISTQASELTTLRTQLEHERTKAMRLFSVVRTMRAASDEIVRIEEEERDAARD